MCEGRLPTHQREEGPEAGAVSQAQLKTHVQPAFMEHVPGFLVNVFTRDILLTPHTG